MSIMGGSCLGNLLWEAESTPQQGQVSGEPSAAPELSSKTNVVGQGEALKVMGRVKRSISTACKRVSSSMQCLQKAFCDRCSEKTRHLLLVWGLAIAMHLHTCWGMYVWDDRAAVIQNPDVNGKHPAWKILVDDFWGAPLTNTNSHKSYRPLTTLSYRINYMLSAFQPFTYHLVNVVLHATACALVLVYARTVLPSEVAALRGALLFVVHPVHVESVTPMVGRADLLCACFYIPALLFYEKSLDPGRSNGRRALHLLGAYVAALLSFAAKEVGLTVFGLFIVHELYPSGVEILLRAGYGRILAFVLASLNRVRRPVTALRLAIIVAVVGGVLALRVWLHGERTVMHWSILENEITYMPTRKQRALATAHTHFIYLWKLFAPFRQTYDYGYACITHVETLSDWRNLLTLSAYSLVAGVTAFALATARKELVWPVALTLVPFMPASHLLVYVGAVVAERLLYIPSLGFCLLMPALAHLWVHDQLPLFDQVGQWVHDQLPRLERMHGWVCEKVKGRLTWRRGGGGQEGETVEISGRDREEVKERLRWEEEGEAEEDQGEGEGEEEKEGKVEANTSTTGKAEETDKPGSGTGSGGEVEDVDTSVGSRGDPEETPAKPVVTRVLRLGRVSESPVRRAEGRVGRLIRQLSQRDDSPIDEGRTEEVSGAVGEEAERERKGRRRRAAREDLVRRGAAFWLGLLGLRSVWYSFMWMNEETVFFNAFRTCPRSAKVANNYGIGFLNPPNARKAIRIFATALETFPQYSNAHYNKALAHFLLGEYESSRLHFILSMRQDTSNTMAYSYLGGCETMMAEQAGINPNATASVRRRWLEAAAFHLDTAISKGVDTAQTFHYRGSVALARNKLQLAVYFFERALAASGRHKQFSTDPRETIGKPYTDEIREAYAYNQMALAYKGLNLFKEAEQAFLRGLQIEPNMYELLANLGVLYLDNGHLDNAKEWFDKALAVNPTAVDMFNNMGVLEEKRGAFHVARKFYRQAAEAAPHVAAVQNNLARVEKALQGLNLKTEGGGAY